MSTGLLKRHNTESHATKRKHCVCLGILPMGPTCPHRIVWFLLPKSVCLRYKPCVLLGTSAERSIIVLSNRWLHWGLFVDDVQTCNYTYMCKYEPAHRKNVHTHRWKCVHQSYKKLHHTVSRCLEIPSSVMTSGHLHYNTGGVLWEVVKGGNLNISENYHFYSDTKNKQDLIQLPFKHMLWDIPQISLGR